MPGVWRIPGRWWRGRARATRPTRDGAWCVIVTVGLGVAAVNTGNNLAYLLCSMLLGLITVSGILSDLTMRRLRLTVSAPGDVHAGRPALVTLALANGKRWLASHSVAIEALAGRPPPRLAYVPRLPAGATRTVAWTVTWPRRGRHPLPALRVVTRFPFGFFLKASPVRATREVLVYPALGPLPAAALREAGGGGDSAARRPGHGTELRELRPYRRGDAPRLVHWPTTARAGELMVRELEADTALDARLVLAGSGLRDRGRLERAISESATLAVHLLRAGAGVELVGPGVRVPLGRGAAHAHRVLAALALFEPGAARGPALPVAPPARGGLREIPISLD
jgi:uncharacterized protein (DUF58 family)